MCVRRTRTKPGGPISAQGRADLHTHTTSSDGTLTPAELIAAAVEVGLAALAITDHDIVAALPEARRAARSVDVELVPGVEFSSNLDGREVHVLGLFIDDARPELIAATERSREFRRERAAEIVDRLQGLDVAIELEAVEAAAEGAAVGRPHIARALLHSGAVESFDEAFNRYIGIGRPGFAPKPTLDATEVIATVHGAGGVAILAHPASSRLSEESILRLADLGLDGFEVFHPKHSPEAAAQLRRLSEKTGLLPSGGSDYHGPGGGGRNRLGAHTVPVEWLEALRAAATRHRREEHSSRNEA